MHHNKDSLSLNKSVFNIEINPGNTATKTGVSISHRTINSARSHMSRKNLPKMVINEDLKTSTMFLIRKQLVFGHSSKYLNDNNMAQYLYLN